MQKLKFKLIQGDSKLFNLSFVKADVPQDITGWTILFRMTSGVVPVITRDITDHVDPMNGKSQLYFSSQETGVLLGAYEFTLKIKDPQDQITSILYGMMTFIKV